MMLPVARLARYAAVVSFLGLAAALFQPLCAQPEEDREATRLNRRLASLIRSIDDIKWSNITIYRLEDEYRLRLTRSMESEDKADIEYVESIGQTLLDEPIPDFAELVRGIAAGPRGPRYETFKAEIVRRLNVDPDDIDDTELGNAYARMRSVIVKRLSRPRQFYMVTSREKLPEPRLIALLGVNIDEVTGTIDIKNVWAGTDMYNYLRTNGPDSTMYSELKMAASEQSPSNLSNQMFVLRDLSEIVLATRTKARATYLDENKYMYVLTGISAGRPIRGNAPAADDSTSPEEEGGGSLFDDAGSGGGLFGSAGGKDRSNAVASAAIPGTAEFPYEVTVGTDVLASFYAYELKNKPVPETRWGIDLRNNFDEINYPSIWGGRLTLNAILENIRIGAVLPQIRFGGNTIDSSGIGSRQQKLLGGYGMVFAGDFTAPLLDNSGLFNFYASYTFSEAETDRMRMFDYTNGLTGETGHLIRYAFQGYYSFGFYADAAATHLFRLKLGGTVYGVDSYIREEDTTVPRDENDPVVTLFTKRGSQSIGGVSGKLEYMRGGINYPHGFSLQYVDQSLMTDLWIQFVVARNLDLKFDLKYFTPVFRDIHAWENPNLVVPAISVKYHF